MYFHALLGNFKSQTQVSQHSRVTLVSNGRIMLPLVMELISNYETGEMTQWSREPGFDFQHTHEESDALSVLCTYCTQMMYRHTCRPNTYTKIKVNFKMFEKVVLSRKQPFS